jgi:NADH-quinone oxidoreductase subunit F
LDLKIAGPPATADERAAVDAAIGPGLPPPGPHAARGGHEARAQRELLLPGLHALQGRVGWISEGGLGYLCERLSVPPAEAYGVASFYAMFALSPRPREIVHVCDDIACGGALLAEKREGFVHSPCLGQCDRAPAALVVRAGDPPVEQVVTHATLERIAAPPPSPPAVTGGTHRRLLGRDRATDWRGLHRARELGPAAVVAEVTAAKLLGRGGAAFPTGKKWEAVAAQAARPHYLVCNADESEPGTFKDRVLLEEDPQAVLEGIAICALATGCEKAFVYVRGEYPHAAERLAAAVRDASPQLGGLSIEIRRGAGAYICGEETALFNSIEGKRGEPRSKPPFPVAVGLFGKPTVVQNVETLANVPFILREGAAAFRSLGTPDSAGTRLFCLSGHIARPGLYEVPMGLPLGELLALAGGATGRIQAILLGGAAGTFVGPDKLSLPLSFEGTRAASATLGSGVVMVFDETTDLPAILRRIAAFFRDESCGQCVPCRVGTVRQEELLARLARKQPLPGDGALLADLGQVMRDASICGLGQTASSAVESGLLLLGDRRG